ncbi:hypothetical protein GFS31_17050 [Leptolyngbya sp. BL0902]|nr:hypothetical protein GFS31_17050 [Leptolyngbya sp. BL0902]
MIWTLNRHNRHPGHSSVQRIGWGNWDAAIWPRGIRVCELGTVG